ncbi:MAG: hypothetical protein IPN34_16945 [Planctomycetes bacterium]|nr:hypothetical protein [Planctomycetota bacterium]
MLIVIGATVAAGWFIACFAGLVNAPVANLLNCLLLLGVFIESVRPQRATARLWRKLDTQPRVREASGRERAS